MRKFKLEVELENDAFREENGKVINMEIRRILEEISDTLHEFGKIYGTLTSSIYDSNGNTCGHYEFTEEDES